MSIRPALSRTLDPTLASNRFLLIATPAIGTFFGFGALLRSESLWESAGWGFYAGGAAFLAWTIAREIHPDHAWVATVATFLAPLGLVWGRSDLMANAVILLVARVVAGTTGRSMRNADILLFVVLGGPVLFRPSGPGVLAMAALGLGATIVWHRHRRGSHVAAAAIYAAGAVAAGFLADDLGWLEGDGLAVLWIGLTAGAISLLGPRTVASPTDRAGGVIVPYRVWAARLVTLAAAAAVSLTHEPAAMAPAWAALIAAASRP